MNDSSAATARRGAPRPRLSPHSRLVMVERVAAGQSMTAVAAQMGCSRQTVDKWVRRYEAEGPAGLADRSSRPRSSPAKTPDRIEQKICRLRRNKRLGPQRLAARVGVPASTVHRVLCRHGLNRLGWIDRPTGQRVRRYEKAHPGELVHIDVKKVAKVPPGGGWRVHGRGSPKAKRKRRLGYTYLHVAVDDHSRVAYVEAHDNERGDTAAAFWRNARCWFNKLNVGIDAVMTDNGRNFTSKAFADALAQNRTEHRRTRPYRPQTNGKVCACGRRGGVLRAEHSAYQRPRRCRASSASSNRRTTTALPLLPGRARDH
ncbi:IS481 family transposase [Candidatus Poriferisocius sp.]|uniref:IS481 family transposase n=1 Tax=Candidatus Poriferisocius sp. TaxID=3101276 RepID=UPI003B58DE5A